MNPYLRIIRISSAKVDALEVLARPKRSENMFRKLLVTDDNTATVILRFVLGVIFFAHGAQKMLGWFGGYGFSGTMAYFTGPAHIPPGLAFLAIAAEFF